MTDFHGRSLAKTLALPAIFVALLTAAAFYPSLQCGLTNWDDGGYINDDPLIRTLSLDSVIAIFRAPHFLGNYHPLTLVTYAVEYAGFQNQPWIYHFDNLVLHVANTVLVLWFLYLLGGSVFAATVAAVLFGIHPLRVESVTWISERKDVLFAFFFVLSLISYLSSVSERRKESWQALALLGASLILFVLSCFSKGVAVSLPLCLVLIDFLNRRKLDLRSVLDKVPFFAVALYFGIVAVQAQAASGSVGDTGGVSIVGKFELASYALVLYFKNLVLPTGLSAIYPYPGAVSAAYPAAVLVCFAAIAATLRKTRDVVFGFGFFLVTIVLLLQVLSVGKAVAADRNTYIPLIGIFYLVGLGCERGVGYLRKRELPFEYAYCAMTAVGVLLAVTTWQRTKVWNDSYTLMNDVLATQPTSADAYVNRALASPSEKFDQAVSDYKRAIEYAPSLGVAYNNLGLLYYRRGDNDEALKIYNTGLQASPSYALLYVNRMYLFFYQKKDYAAAYSDYQRAVALGYQMDAAFVKELEAKAAPR